MRIGIDYGGVCSVDREQYEEGADFCGELGINVPDCLSSLRLLKTQGHSLFLVSFCGSKRAQLTRKYFHSLQEDLFEEFIFVKKRIYKVDVCQAYGLNAMIDDRLDILLTMPPPIITIHFNGHQSDSGIRHFHPSFHVTNWQEIVAIVDSLLMQQVLARNDEAIDKLGNKCYNTK